jgi:hypothetical protein
MKIPDFIKVFIVAIFVAASVSAQSASDGTAGKILFLTCSFVYDSVKQDYIMKVVDKDVVAGKLKAGVNGFQSCCSGGALCDANLSDFKYKVLDQSSNVIREEHIPSPLDKTLKTFDAQGRPIVQNIRVDSSEVFLRLQLTPDMQTIVFDRGTAAKGNLRGGLSGKQLLSINLKGE